MQTIRHYSSLQFKLVRIALGTYLFCHFAHLLTVGTELLSSSGIIPNANMNLSFPFFPNILYFLDAPIWITAFLSILALSSLCLVFNKLPRLNAAFLWYGFACIFHRNNFISNPSLFYIGWLLLAFVVIKRKEMPKILFDGAWFITGLSYTISGVHKLTTISWQNGEALYHLLDNPLARNNMLVETLLDIPMPLLKLATWSVLLLEILAIVFVMVPKLRKYLWLGLTMLHLGILTTVNFADLTLGMLVFQLFIFDTDWLKSKSREKITLFYDSDCGVCNGFIRFIMDNNSKENIYFAPLESELGEKIIREHGLENKDTMIVKKEDGVLIESQAVLEVFGELDSIYPIVSWLRFMPGVVRNAGYRLFAKYRYRIFKMKTCALLGERERGRFLG